MTNQEQIDLFADLTPAPSKLHLVVPRYEGSLELVEGGSNSKSELLFKKGALVVGLGLDVISDFYDFGTDKDTIAVGDRVWLSGNFHPDHVFTREGVEMIVVDKAYIATVQHVTQETPEEAA